MIPDRKGGRWYEKKAVVEALATVPPVLAAAAGALTSLSDRHRRALGWWLLAGVAWLVGASVGKVLHARSEDRSRRRTDEHDGLRAALHVLFAMVCRTAGIMAHEQNSGRLRLTIHRVVANGKAASPEELEQLLPYMGGPGNPPGRRFSIRSGIIGLAARRKAAQVARRKSSDHHQFVDELIDEWAFTEQDARKVTHDRQAWMAVPVLGAANTTVAVVYLDSEDPEIFTDGVQEVVLAACKGIRRYTMEAFP